MSEVDLTGLNNTFMFIWNILDTIFSYITNGFKLVFNAIPDAAIGFLIGIFCYSLVAIFSIAINHYNVGYKYIILRVFYVVFLVILLLFSIWRIGIVSMLDEQITIYTFTEFLINLFYILFGVALFITFYKKVPWLRRALLIFLWAMLILLTFVICPIVENFQLSDSTLIQILILTTIFAVPNIKLYFEEKSQDRGDLNEKE